MNTSTTEGGVRRSALDRDGGSFHDSAHGRTPTNTDRQVGGAAWHGTAKAVSPLGRYATALQTVQIRSAAPSALQSKIQNPKSKIPHEQSGAALIIAVAIFAVLLFIALTFWSQSRLEHRAAVRNQESFRTGMIAGAAQSLAVAHLRLDEKWHPTYTSLDHGWNTYFNGAWVAGKPWAFRGDTLGTRVLDRTWTSWASGSPYKRIPEIDFWSDVKLQEAQLDLAIQKALFIDGVDGIDNDGDGNIDEADETKESLGSALAAIKNPLFVPRYQIDPNDDNNPSLVSLLDRESAALVKNLVDPGGPPQLADFFGPLDFPVQYGYDFTNFDLAYNDPLNIPDADYDPFAAGWPAAIVTPQQKINIFADVDNDGDGLRDSMWIPIGVEVFRGGIDRDGDGRKGADEGGDGLDNDLDGEVDEPDETAVFVYWGGNDGLDNDQDGDIDEADEQHVFLTAPIIADSYWGGNDGEDNDQDGDIDEADEQRVYLTSEDRINNNDTAPRVPANLPVITPAESTDYQDPGENIPLLDPFTVRVNLVTLNEFIKSPNNPIQISSDTDSSLFISDPADPFGPSVDRLDNDYTQIINDTHGHAYIQPDSPERDPDTGNLLLPWSTPAVLAAMQQNRARSYSRIDTSSYPVSDLVFPFLTAGGVVPVVTASGETVCVIAGRVAIHIVDEASKVNLNSAGAIATVSPQDVPNSTGTNSFVYLRDADRLTYAHSEGVSNGEIDPRVLPDIGVAQSLDVAMTRTGEHRDAAGGGKPQNFPIVNAIDANDSDRNGANDNDAEAGYAYDAYYPGFGRADDNANALQLQFDGLDNDGDGAFYTHDNIDNDGDGIIDEPDEARFGIDEPFEGIDEPQELQLFRPLRNRIAELDGIDNDGDFAIDEIGELGDRLYSTGDELQGALASGPFNTAVAEMAPLRSVLTVQSSDPNARYQHYVGGAQGDLARNIPPDSAPVTGMKIDFNYTTPDVIVNALKEDWSYPAMDDVLRNEIGYLPVAGNADFAANPYLITASIYASTANAFDYTNDIRFEAAYFAGLRRESMTVIGTPIGIIDTRYEAPQNAVGAGPGRMLEADAGLRAYQLALNIVDARDTDHLRNALTYRQGDQWWSELFRDPLLPAGVPAPALREMSYTLAGTEGIRINEIMVRAVRRVEAESNFEWDPVTGTGNQPENNPNLFSDGPADFDVLAEFINERVTTAIPNNGTLLWTHFPVDLDPVDPLNDRVGLGSGAGFATDVTEVFDPGNGNTYDNVVQFRFGPSAQLPPGRYYLMVNSVDGNGVPTVTNEIDIDYRVKYVRAGDPDILDDAENFPGLVIGNPFADLDIQQTVLADPIVGYKNGSQPLNPVAGQESGWVFLPTREIRPSLDPLMTLPVGFEGYAGIPGEDELQNEAYTVIVPPFAANPADQYYLCIAIRKVIDDDVPIAINYFDFSQEPDHEWIELVNVSASPNPIDLSGWLLEVGGGSNDPTNTRYTIPADTHIAPNGSLLLTANKYDNGSIFFTVPGARISASNGIGMASQPASLTSPFSSVDPPPIITSPTVGVTEPPIPRYATPGENGFVGQPAFGLNAWNGRWGEPLGSGGLGAESDFQRLIALDFVDRDGDGVAAASDDDFVISTVDSLGGNVPTKAWDRIVQIEPVGSNLLGFTNPPGVVTRVDAIAEMVLRGGIFPNYPENDLVDNDADNAELERDGVDNDGDRAFIDFDGVDNDGDGLTDEGSDGVDNNGNGLIDDAAESEFLSPLLFGAVDEPGEGIDEGSAYRALGISVPGSFGRDPILFAFRGEPEWVEGLGSTPEWKEFTERRMFPGDCVRVTLYAGRPEEAFIVDRVTYNQNDVENRAPDDVLSAYSVLASGPGTTPDALIDRFLMSAGDGTGGITGNPRAWPENTMGVDFYRSLERKHPLYPGDRFGTANRWTATDGNYDDWAPGTNRWFFDTEASNAPFEISMMSDMVVGPVGSPIIPGFGILYFAHGFSGSPLRANFFQRVLEDRRLGYSPDPPVRLVGNDAPVVSNALVDDNHALLARARVRNANFRSPGDLLTVPHMTLSRTYANVLHDQLGREGLQGPTVAPEDMLPGPIPPHIKGASIGGDFPKDLRALIDIASFDSIVLNVGQADFYPLYPFAGSLTSGIGPQVELVKWHRADGSTPAPGDIDTNYPYRAPVGWAPVFLASLDPGSAGSEPESDSFAGLVSISVNQTGTPQYPHLINLSDYPVQLAFLYRNADLSGVPPYGNNTSWLLRDGVAPAGSPPRWPLERRAMMYVSTNPDGFRPESYPHDRPPPTTVGADIHPSEALFIWDGADGLSNGEYDLFVVTMPDMTGLAASTRAFDPNRNDWLPAKLESVRRRLPIDIQVLTDKDGDRKCWIDGTGPSVGLPDTVELGLNTQAGPQPRETFPLKAGLVPASDGTVHYGVVKVENNFLGVFVRNWSAPNADNVNAVSRVVLMSRDRTPGRINVNTALTQPIARDLTVSTDYHAFNPLTGLVGFMAEYEPIANTDQGIFTPVPWNDADNVATAPDSLVPPLYTFNAANANFFYSRALQRATHLIGPSPLTPIDALFLPRGERMVDYNSDGLPDPPVDITGDGLPDPPVRYDGRYLLSPGELLVSGDEGAFAPRSFVMMPSILPQYYDLGVTPTANQKAQQFDELTERYARMGNSLTAVSDTFEIYVTAQSGYCFDANRDGVLNWRDENEFVIAGEKKTRTVYER